MSILGFLACRDVQRHDCADRLHMLIRGGWACRVQLVKMRLDAPVARQQLGR